MRRCRVRGRRCIAWHQKGRESSPLPCRIPAGVGDRAGGGAVDDDGAEVAAAGDDLDQRGSLFVAPGVELYERKVVGENARSEDMDVNVAKERKLTNMRSSTPD